MKTRQQLHWQHKNKSPGAAKNKDMPLVWPSNNKKINITLKNNLFGDENKITQQIKEIVSFFMNKKVLDMFQSNVFAVTNGFGFTRMTGERSVCIIIKARVRPRLKIRSVLRTESRDQ